LTTYDVIGENYKIERTFPFRVAFLNDIHVGSKFGAFPENYGVKLNVGQEALASYIDDYADHCNETKTNMLWVDGDTICGQNPKEGGRYVLKIELEDQKDAAAKLISDFCKKVPSIEEVWLWRSTGYHGSRDTGVDLSITEKLTAKYDIKTKYLDEYSYINLHYKEFVKRLWVTHTAPDSYMYPEQAMGKDMMLYQEAVAQKKLPPVDIIIRAHKHFFAEVHKASIKSIQLPCFQFFVPYDNAVKNFSKFQPDIGSIILMFDDHLRSTTWHFIYPNVIDAEKMIEVNLNEGVGRKRLS
jgi:hypothetical protein